MVNLYRVCSFEEAKKRISSNLPVGAIIQESYFSKKEIPLSQEWLEILEPFVGEDFLFFFSDKISIYQGIGKETSLPKGKYEWDFEDNVEILESTEDFWKLFQPIGRAKKKK